MRTRNKNDVMFNGCHKEDRVNRCIYRKCYIYSDLFAFVLKFVFLMFIQHYKKYIFFN